MDSEITNVLGTNGFYIGIKQDFETKSQYPVRSL